MDEGPAPKIRPVLMMAIFSSLIGICAGPAYNSNAARGFLRDSGFLFGSPKPEQLLAEGIKIFQTIDVMSGGIVGLIFELAGPRITHTLGYIFFGIGIILMTDWRTLWFGMFLQGAASCFLVSSALHLANLHEKRNKFALCVLSSAAELTVFVFPALRIGLLNGLSTYSLMSIFLGVPCVGVLMTLILFPDEPFFPRSESSRLTLNRESFEEERMKVDERDRWNEDISSHNIDIITSSESTPLVIRDRNRISAMSISMVAMSDPPSKIRPVEESFQSQLLSTEWILITLLFTFFIFRVRPDIF